ncbi:MAG: ribbon-helix-helix protein, CopG family [Solirubrobacteraceae bacterium]
MIKTTVYLRDSDAAAVRRIAAETGRSQADVIREAIASAAALRPRRFRSAGIARGTGEPVAEHADEIVRREMGRGSLP